MFTLVAKLESVRLLIALVALNKWKIHQMDVISVFFNGVLKKEKRMWNNLRDMNKKFRKIKSTS